MADTEQTSHLPRRTLLSYATASVGYGMLDLPLNVLLMFFYTDVLKLAPLMAGVGSLIGMLWDAVTDPTMGHISDRTRTTMGRRRPYLLAVAVPLGVTFFMMWTPVATNHLFANFVIAHMALFTMLTVFLVPYNSLAAELSPNYDERTRIQGYRESGHIIGLVIGALFPFLVDRIASMRPGYSLRTAYSTLAAIFGGVMTVVALITFRGVREDPAFQRRPQVGGWQGIKLVASNRFFMWLVATFVFANIGNLVPSVMVSYALKYWIKAGEEKFTFVLITYLAVAVCAIPLWVRLSSRIGKKWAYFVALIWSTVSLAAIFFVRPGSFIPLAIAFGVAGAAYGALWILSYSIVADIIDYDELKSGERREGTYFGAWTFLQKVTVAGAYSIIGVVLKWIGYVPDQEQAVHTILGMRVLMAWVPAAMYLIAAVILLRFPFTREVHLEIQQALRQKKEAANTD